MAEVGDKLVDLKSLSAVFEAIGATFEKYLNYFDQMLEPVSYAIEDLYNKKLNTPDAKGTIGQVLTLKDDRGNTEWKDMSASISEADIRRIVDEQLANMNNGNVDVVRQSTHHTDYTKDTLEFVTDSTGKVINAYFMSK